ncbi:MAG: hypothetical protein WCW16_05545 [Candidatus Magasanikbacteria bacterium]
MALKESVIKTLSYFDLFQYPLTREELYRNLWDTDSADLKLDYTDFVKQVEVYDEIGYKHGFYFLSGNEEHVARRQNRVRIIEEKMQIAKRGIKKLRWIPFVRAVCVCNTVALGTAVEESDVDIFVIARKGRIWFVRFWSTLILKLFRLRTSKGNMKNKICLSFFVSDSQLNLEFLCAFEDDIYLVYWLGHLVPVYDPDNLLHSMYKANTWTKKYVPHAYAPYILLENWKVEDSKCSKWGKVIGERIDRGIWGSRCENYLKRIQLPRINTYYGPMLKKQGTEVVVTDTILKFHENDRRKEYYTRWRENYDARLVRELK